MKNFFSIIVLAVIAISSQAQGLQRFFVDTPDSIQPYMKKLDREAMLLSADPSKDTCSYMSILYGGTVCITHLSPELIVFHPSKTFTQEFAILPTDSDSLFCVVSTYKAPEGESNVKIYDKDWSLLSTLELTDKAKLTRPDSISETRFEEIVKNQEIKMVLASIDKKNTKQLNVEYSMPLMSSDEKKAFLPLILKTNLKWNGKTFN
ncbi:MAG: DUF3256 family protein [Prevotella sp.]|nr:DUF3256 family protein [Prevotella sp.]